MINGISTSAGSFTQVQGIQQRKGMATGSIRWVPTKMVILIRLNYKP